MKTEMNLKEKKLFLLDMDGTIYLDDDLFDGTLDFLDQVKKQGAKYLFVTNNSSKGADAYVEKMKRIGIPATKEDFLTSTDATVLYLKKNHPDTLFYAMGTESFVRQLRESGIRVTTEAEDTVGGVVISNDQELTFKKLNDVCFLLKRDIPYVATNPDWVCPTSYGYVPDCGSFAESIGRATGKKPYFIGKPRPEMLLLAMEREGLKREDCVMIGDRLYTDIASGVNAGIDTVFVLSGEGTMADVESSDQKPTLICQGVAEIRNLMIR